MKDKNSKKEEDKKNKEDKKNGFLTVAIIFGVMIAGSIYKGHTILGRGDGISLANSPTEFWLFMVAYGFVVIYCLAAYFDL